MSKETESAEQSVDKGLIAMFLRMSPEERLRANDDYFRTILELRNACKRQKAGEHNQKMS